LLHAQGWVDADRRRLTLRGLVLACALSQQVRLSRRLCSAA